MTARHWRLILDGACDGAWNMGVDGALLASRGQGGPPTLRLYRWRVPTASLGRFQPLEDVDAAACRIHGVDVVRRATGGRGVLHDDELTYSVTASEADGLPRGVGASYRYLGAALTEAYRLLGVAAELTDEHRGMRGSAACYLAATRADLSLAGAKLSGSAQVWRDGTCLQHGSFVVSRDVAREAAVFRLDPAAAEVLAAQAVTIEQAVGARLSDDRLAEAVAAGFERALGVELEPGGLTGREEEAASSIAASSRLLTGGNADVGA